MHNNKYPFTGTAHFEPLHIRLPLTIKKDRCQISENSIIRGISSIHLHLLAHPYPHLAVIIKFSARAEEL
jgi:hypothetical protein